RGSREQRLSLLQGLMDTDGTVDRKKGNVTFDNTDEVLVNAVIELACSLGHKPGRKTVKKCTLHGKKCKDCYSVTWTAPEYVFRLKRKIDLQKLSTRRTTKFRYIVKAEKIESRPGRCITVDSPNGLYLAGERFVPTHNTFALLMEPIYHMGVPGFGAVIFRRTTPQVRNEGGLWDTSMKIYPLIEGFEATPKESTLEWSFPPYNNKVKFAHLEYEKNKLDWQGSQIPLICFDELTHFTQSQFFYLLSRNRSMCGVKPYIRATTNPDADSWVASFIDWWIDDDGFPIEERSGVIRWFIRVNDAIRWGDSKEDLESNYPGSIAKSFTFIPAKLEDNKILEETDPAYRANLRALSYVDNERLEKGNWKIKPEAGTIFKRAWFEIIEPREVPHNIDRFVRFWDLAGTEATKANKDPDWTVGLKLAEHNDIYYILDVVRVQVDPFEVKATVKHTCNIDGYMVPARMEQEPGSSGKAVIDMYRSEVFQGYNFDGLPSTGSKVARANPVSIAAGAGRIKIVRAPWNEGFLSELEYFPDGPHDDQVDGLSGAFNFLNKMNIGPTISEPARMQKRFRPGKVKKPIIF
ncbi:MAG: phage terminase large subunit, partial [Fermentimonas sp.]